jgi:hypothetical protein
MVYFFSSVAHVWVPGAKTTGQIVKKFYVSENFKFQCDPFSNKKDVSQRSSCHLGPVRNGIFLTAEKINLRKCDRPSRFCSRY